MKKILITGVAGMIGSHLLDELLLRGYHVIGVDDLSFGKMGNVQHNLENKNFSFHKIDILDFDRLREVSEDIDVIVHLAALKKLGEEKLDVKVLEINGRGTENIFRLANMKHAKVIFSSTSDVYGMSNDIPFREDGDVLIGASSVKRWSYAVSKLYGEHTAFAYHRQYGLPAVVIRYFGGFSPRSSFAWSGGHIPIFIDSVLNDREIIVHGDGKQTRSMAYISDIVEGTILAMESEKAVGEIINIGNDEEVSVIDSLYLISDIANTGKKLKIKFVPFKDIFGAYRDVPRRVPDLTKAERLLGYKPKVSFKEALKITIEERKRQLANL